MHVSRLGIVLYCVTLAACGKTTPPAPPVIVPPGANETISGTERIGWDQRAADPVELATIRYAIYADGTRSELAEASCASSATSAGFACSARLPALSAGPHTLQLASFTVDGSVLESPRSASLNVTVVAATADVLSSGARGQVIETADGVKLRVELVADGLDRPSDLAIAPDGRLFVAERGGRIRIVRDARVAPAAAWSLPEEAAGAGQVLALALDPQFEQNRFVFAIYTAPSRAGDPAFSLARFREVSDTLADRVLLLDEVRASQGDAAASLRFGPDAKLYAAFDDGGEPRLAGDLASPNGKLLRLNPDGSTPVDQAGGTPLYSYAYRFPSGLDWDPSSGSWWIADRDTMTSARLSAVAPAHGARPGETHGVVRGRYALPSTTPPSSVAFYRGRRPSALTGNLLIASDEGRHLLRLRFDPQNPARILATERLLQDLVGGVRAVAVSPEGAIYFATARAIGRLVPD